MKKFIHKITNISLILIFVLVVGGCANNGSAPSPEPAEQQASQAAAVKEKAVIDNFNALRQKTEVTVPEIIEYIDGNIAAVSQAGAATMIIGLEAVQKEKLPKLQDKFGDNEAVQKVLAKSYKNGLTSQAISSIENKEARDLLLETQSSGFKIETAEGMYFPVIDYAFYNKYRNAVAQDIVAYIDIMTVESDKTPVKDAALMISWSEIIRRAKTQEQFIKDYANSAKIEDMRQLLKRYSVFALYGANNTPLFSYDTKQMVPEARKTYSETAFDANSGSFSKVMSGFLVELKKNEYKLTAEIQEYRDKAAGEI